MNRKIIWLFCAWLLGSPVRAEGTFFINGQLSEEAGWIQNAPTSLQPYQYSRLLIQSHGDLDSEFSWGLDGEADQQSSGSGLAPSWLTYAAPNAVNGEVDGNSSNTSYQMARLNRAFLKWTSGRWDITAGLQSYDGGLSYFYEPTRYFNPLPPLSWVTDESLGSEGVNANCFLFDDLSVEGSARWLADGTGEWVARLVDKGIGITITPSFASLQGRNGAGLEISGTFPDFQVRVEGVNWFYPDNSTQLEWVAGLSTLIQGTKLTVEGFQDSDGEVLGEWAGENLNTFYLFASATRDFSGKWQASPSVVKAVNGGPLLLWPQASVFLSQDWKLSFQAQWPVGAAQGPLSLYPGRSGLSLAYIF